MAHRTNVRKKCGIKNVSVHLFRGDASDGLTMPVGNVRTDPGQVPAKSQGSMAGLIGLMMPVGNVLAVGAYPVPIPAKSQSAMTGIIGLTMPVGNVRGGHPRPRPSRLPVGRVCTVI